MEDVLGNPGAKRPFAIKETVDGKI